MISRRQLLGASVLLSISLAGCTRNSSDSSEDTPPSLKLGRDTCDACGMIISDERFASGITGSEEGDLLFDDPGEMILRIQDEGLENRTAWVHDFDSVEWIKADTATYVTTREYPTPMGTGVIPFADESTAREFADDKNGTVQTWEEMLKNWTFGELHAHLSKQ